MKPSPKFKPKKGFWPSKAWGIYWYSKTRGENCFIEVLWNYLDAQRAKERWSKRMPATKFTLRPVLITPIPRKTSRSSKKSTKPKKKS